jgi:hypothetical protein
LIRQLLREPLLHFLVLGSLVFALFHALGDRDEVTKGSIVVSAGKVEQLSTGFFRTWQRPPTALELEGLIEDHVREEVLYRQALALGLDRDDTIVRRRLRQKLEFLTEEAGAEASPTEQQLQAWLDRHPDQFGVEPKLALAQVFFSAGRGAEAPDKALAGLPEPDRIESAANLGDPSTLPPEMPLSRIAEIASVFGAGFAQQVQSLPSGRWAGPVQSTYGWHLVYVGERTPGRPRPLAEVREAVQREWLLARRKAALDASYTKLRAGYEVEIANWQPVLATRGAGVTQRQ